MLNKVVLIGRMGRDPELKYTTAGVAVVTFSLAVQRDFKGPAGEKETDWFDVVAWRQTAEFCAQYMAKGRLVAVEGRLQKRSWVTEDGQKRNVVEIVANQVQGLDRPKDSGQSGGYGETPDNFETGEGDFNDADYDPFEE